MFVFDSTYACRCINVTQSERGREEERTMNQLNSDVSISTVVQQNNKERLVLRIDAFRKSL